MNCYIGENLTQVSVEMQPQLVKAQDTTNDSFQCALKANTDPNPIKPMTPFKVVYDDNTSQVFWVSNDSVTVFSLNPKTYKHSLTLVQYRYFLNKHILRNTVFNQPRNQTSILYSSIACCLFSDNGEYVVDANIENVDKLTYAADQMTTSNSKVMQNFDELVHLFTEHGTTVRVHTSAIKHSQTVEEALRQNKGSVVISLDSGSSKTYKKIKTP